MNFHGIVLKTIPLREHDRLVVCYTREAGKHAYQARGVTRERSIQGRHLEPFNLVRFSIVESRRQPIIIGAASERSFFALKSSLSALAAGFFLLECFDRVVYDAQPDQDLWEFLVGTLASIDRSSERADTDWQDVLETSYSGLLSAMGYHGDSQLAELGYANFHSLKFFFDVCGRKGAPAISMLQ